MARFSLGRLKSIFATGAESFSERMPTPQSIGGPITGLGEAAVSTGLGITGKLYEGGRQISGDVQDISGKTQEALGKGFGALTGAPGSVVSGVTAPVGQLSKDILPLVAIAAAIVLLK
tara:strand:- start:15 stop:368 length:354 start_codon:yes stop_codon:yes gene_type:complete